MVTNCCPKLYYIRGETKSLLAWECYNYKVNSFREMALLLKPLHQLCICQSDTTLLSLFSLSLSHQERYDAREPWMNVISWQLITLRLQLWNVMKLNTFLLPQTIIVGRRKTDLNGTKFCSIFAKVSKRPRLSSDNLFSHPKLWLNFKWVEKEWAGDTKLFTQ